MFSLNRYCFGSRVYHQAACFYLRNGIRSISHSKRSAQTPDILHPTGTSEPAPTLPTLDWDRGGRTIKEGLTPLYASMKKLIDSNQGNVCLIQVGSFYELYFEQATTYAPKLGLKVASRKTNNFVIPMAGFPVYQLQKFVKILVHDLEVNVAIIDQFPGRGKSLDNIIHRRISRIVSPGTLVDESFLNFSQNNYLLSISFLPNCTNVPADEDSVVGLSWIDLSVGEFYVQQTTLGDLIADITRINPSEVIIGKEFQEINLASGSWYPPLQDLRKFFLRYHKTAYTNLKINFKNNLQVTRKALENFSVREEAAMNMILSYIQVNLPDSNPSLEVPTQFWNQNCLQMDSRTREALELTERSTHGRNSAVGSLLSTIRRTVTPSGTRLLTQWIKSPSLDVVEIRRRQDFVTLFMKNKFLKLTLISQLLSLGDFVRSVQKLSFNSGDTVTNLLAVAEGLAKLNDLKSFLNNEYESDPDECQVLGLILPDFYVPISLSTKILNTLHVEYNEVHETEDVQVEEVQEEQEMELEKLTNSGSYSNKSLDKYKSLPRATSEQAFSFSIKRDYNELLAEHHDSLDVLKSQEIKLLQETKDDLHKIDPKLNVIKKAQHGRYLNVLYISGKQKLVDEAYELLGNEVREKRKASLVYKPQEWSKLQAFIDEKTEQIKVFEREIIEDLRLNVLEEISAIRHGGRMVDFLDVTTSFAVLAEENNLVCPRFLKSPSLTIEEGRHLVVESGLKSVSSMFVPNDTALNSASSLWVISGPNMGGKSTFLRQNALIVILAQIGSFVPAVKAKLGVVDKIFTRIGASDDLFSDLSTFMVEMVETSNILKNATPRSLAIVDEIGRGTSGKEGLAIAYATLLNLLKVNKCRTLFATHFGKELNAMLTSNSIDQHKIRYYRTRVIRLDNGQQSNDPSNSKNLNLIIDHKLEPGISERSYALEVAQMAGFPKQALKNAKAALESII